MTLVELEDVIKWIKENIGKYEDVYVSDADDESLTDFDDFEVDLRRAFEDIIP